MNLSQTLQGHGVGPKPHLKFPKSDEVVVTCLNTTKYIQVCVYKKNIYINKYDHIYIYICSRLRFQILNITMSSAFWEDQLFMNYHIPIGLPKGKFIFHFQDFLLLVSGRVKFCWCQQIPPYIWCFMTWSISIPTASHVIKHHPVLKPLVPNDAGARNV